MGGEDASESAIRGAMVPQGKGLQQKVNRKFREWEG